jgi:cytochrome c5
MQFRSTHALMRSLFICGLAFSAMALSAAESENFDAAEKYQSTCYACHTAGAAHAPMIDDTIEWEIRLEKGLDTLVQSTINGLNGVMPARGLCTDCSDSELKEIVEYMLKMSQ